MEGWPPEEQGRIRHQIDQAQQRLEECHNRVSTPCRQQCRHHLNSSHASGLRRTEKGQTGLSDLSESFSAMGVSPYHQGDPKSPYPKRSSPSNSLGKMGKEVSDDDLMKDEMLYDGSGDESEQKFSSSHGHTARPSLSTGQMFAEQGDGRALGPPAHGFDGSQPKIGLIKPAVTRHQSRISPYSTGSQSPWRPDSSFSHTTGESLSPFDNLGTSSSLSLRNPTPLLPPQRQPFSSRLPTQRATSNIYDSSLSAGGLRRSKRGVATMHESDEEQPLMIEDDSSGSDSDDSDAFQNKRRK